ncbi:MAG TPA: heme-binding protein [Candidatus Binataceae bacterium]|nr:heme-binding protein [Candidatus Binataceae bacterium]HVB80042.1 heme-binding protein [Candidatus Binataceae bacterium]
MAQTYTKSVISFELAHQMVGAAAAKAQEINVPQVIAVIDDTGYLKAFARMDGAPLMCEEIAASKAFTALFGMPTEKFFDALKGEPSLMAGLFHRPRIAAFGGGLPITIGNQVVGAIGVSGGTAAQDIECAQAALELVK